MKHSAESRAEGPMDPSREDAGPGDGKRLGIGVGLAAIAACLVCGLPFVAALFGLGGLGFGGLALGPWLIGGEGTPALAAGLLTVATALAFWLMASNRKKRRARA